MNQTNSYSTLQEKVSCSSTISCSAIASIHLPKNSLSMLKNKSNSKSKEQEIIQHLLSGLEIMKFFKVSMIGDGEEQNIERIIRNYSKLSSQRLLNMKVHIFLTFLHLLFMESEIMEFKEVEILISGQFGQVELNSNHTSRMLETLIVNLELKLYQCGKPSSKLSIQILLMNHQQCYFTKDITVDLALSETT